VAASDSNALDIYAPTFPEVAAQVGLAIPTVASSNPGVSEESAADFVLAVLRERRVLRWRFPQGIAQGAGGKYAHWLAKRGARKFSLSSRAQKKIDGAFRRPPGEKIYELYLNDFVLQQYFPLALLPIGQKDFLGWLTTYGRADQNVRDVEILWFLAASREHLARGVMLTYLLNPAWQQQFPLALTSGGWKPFARWVREQHRVAVPNKAPTVLSMEAQRSLIYRFGSGKGSSAVPPLGVNILSHFCFPSGLQQAALSANKSLERCGVPTSCRDVPAGIKTELDDRARWLGLEAFPASLIMIPPVPYFAACYERSGLFRRDDVYRIAYWHWELERVPDEWIEVAPLIDEIWAPTEFIARAMRSQMPRPVYHMMPGVEIGEVERVSRAALGLPKDHCIFLFMFDMFSQMHRKNPLGLIRAFREAFRAADRATLVIKLSGGSAFPDDLADLKRAADGPNIQVIDQLLSRPAAYGLIEMCDCYVSLHRSEGFGLGLAEAMLMGRPVIATGYSGNLEFMNETNSLLVDYEMVEITEDKPIYTKGNRWAEPSVSHAAAQMRQVYEQREEAIDRARRVQPEIQEKLSLEAAGRRMATRLAEIAQERARTR
jgi:glycosyltransferase involved in cell wall biosynthesis